MRTTTIIKVIGAVLLVSSTVQVASAAEHRTRGDRATAIEQEQFRDSNNYFAGPGSYYAEPDNFAVWPRAWPEQDEAAMSSGTAGR